MENPLLALKREWFVHTGSEYSKRRLLLHVRVLEAALRFAGLWGNTVEGPQPIDARGLSMKTPEEWAEFARGFFYDNVEEPLSSSAVNEALISALAEALPALVGMNREGQRKALTAQRDRAQCELDTLNAQIAERGE